MYWLDPRSDLADVLISSTKRRQEEEEKNMQFCGALVSFNNNLIHEHDS